MYTGWADDGSYGQSLQIGRESGRKNLYIYRCCNGASSNVLVVKPQSNSCIGDVVNNWSKRPNHAPLNHQAHTAKPWPLCFANSQDVRPDQCTMSRPCSFCCAYKSQYFLIYDCSLRVQSNREFQAAFYDMRTIYANGIMQNRTEGLSDSLLIVGILGVYKRQILGNLYLQTLVDNYTEKIY